jgi:hypothetical protein
MRAFRPLSLVLLAGCTATGAGGGGGDGFAVEPGKEDDFLSNTAREFVIEGRATVEIEEELAMADEETRMARVRELVGYHQVLVAWFLTQYLIEKKPDDSNYGYGGYGAMARANSYEELDIRAEEGRVYSYAVQQLVAGDPQLMSRIPTMLTEDGQREFTLTIGKPTNDEMAELETNHEWYRRAPWDGWNPATVDPSRKTDLVLTIREETRSEDAWLDFGSMFADGVLTIDVHMGWDYHAAYHVAHARALHEWLAREGWQPPVASFEMLDRTSGPYTRTLEAGGREVRAEVRIFYGHEDGETDPDTAAGGRLLEEDMRASLGDRDVIMYSGHSGPFYGFALANWRMTEEGDLDDSEMATVEMPAERYQLVVAEGCDTYHIGEAFRQNPAKPDGRYIDIITTTAPSNASSPGAVQDIISRLIESDATGRHAPRTLMTLLRDLDSNSSWFHTMYGIHGIDDDPHRHPWGVVENLCQPCSADDTCGGVGNRCVQVGESGRRCAVSCTADDGCPDGYSCRAIASRASGTLIDRACVPTDSVCP